jgi:hypothetical protein
MLVLNVKLRSSMPEHTCLYCKDPFERHPEAKGWKILYCCLEHRKLDRRRARNRRYYLKRKGETNG